MKNFIPFLTVLLIFSCSTGKSKKVSTLKSQDTLSCDFSDSIGFDNPEILGKSFFRKLQDSKIPELSNFFTNQNVMLYVIEHSGEKNREKGREAVKNQME